ncbi:MAG: VCBS repeat-containing protein [Pirellulaceae bacterium]|nr:VCBS repeat-containing protein [Pirellulaceae bacterium]
MTRLISMVIGLLCLQCFANAQSFETVEIDPTIGKVCYAVTAADVNQDGKLDAVAISEREAFWYRNPDWKRHTIISDAVPQDHVCIAAHDIDGDGKVDFALGAGWPKNGGTIHWLSRGKSLDQPWTVHDISAEPWTHRMRWADVVGDSDMDLVVTPLNATVGSGIRLMAFPIPNDPVAGPWKPIVLDASLDRAHNHWHLPGSSKEQTVIASQQGISLLEATDAGFRLKNIARGASGTKPNEQGSGEVKSGKLASGKMIFAAIEPMHGNQVVVYLTDASMDAAKTERLVLDDSFVQGHAVWCADLNDDGSDEVIAAYRNPSKGPVTDPGIYIFQATDDSGKAWKRRPLDPNMACEDIWCADFNADGNVDVLAGGRATHNVKLYLNQGQ